jgi:hypothetical protein
MLCEKIGIQISLSLSQGLFGPSLLFYLFLKHIYGFSQFARPLFHLLLKLGAAPAQQFFGLFLNRYIPPVQVDIPAFPYRDGGKTKDVAAVCVLSDYRAIVSYRFSAAHRQAPPGHPSIPRHLNRH